MDPGPENPSAEQSDAAGGQTAPSDAQPPLAPVAPKPDEGGPTENKEPKYKHRRTGKVACLPKVIRDQINQMILDGIPLRKIPANIGEHGKDLSEDSLSEWNKGGYKDWLQDQERAEDVGRTRDAALALVDQKAGATVQDAGRTIASAQLYELLLSFDPRAFAAALQEKPELYFRLINALSRLSEGEAVCSRRRAQGSLIEGEFNAAQNGDGTVVIPADKLNQLIRLIKLL
jgi:hypothetical protein